MGLKFQGIVFDWADTLINYPGSSTDPDAHNICVSAMHEWFLAEWPDFDVTKSKFFDTYYEVTLEQIKNSSDTGREHSITDRFHRVLNLCGVRIHCNSNLNDAESRFCDILLEHCHPVPGLLDALSELSGNLRILMLSNHPTPELVYRSLKNAECLDFFDAIAVSGATGWVKPHARAFSALNKLCPHDQRDFLFVGDDLKNDIWGAQSAGYHTAWIRPARKQSFPATPDWEIGNLSELTALLGK